MQVKVKRKVAKPTNTVKLLKIAYIIVRRLLGLTVKANLLDIVERNARIPLINGNIRRNIGTKGF
jgi:hypothetical protein